MRCALWPEGSAEEHAGEIEEYFAGRLAEPLAVRIAVDGEGRTVGFAELSIRNVAEGCHTDRVAYLEGWFVSPEVRRRGIGRLLVEEAERWGRAQGCRELASDTPTDNAVSIAAHRAIGFKDAGAIRCFAKDL
jgi:aminoglycoside 6'-N-acetyltransferase I